MLIAGFDQLPTYLDGIPNLTDIPSRHLLLKRNGTWTNKTLRGGSDNCADAAVFERVAKVLADFSISSSRPWLPREIVVQLIAFNEARGSDLHWPKSIPSPPPEALPNGFKSTPENVVAYDFKVPSRFAEEVVALSKRAYVARPNSAIIVGGQKWAVLTRQYLTDDEILRQIVRERATDPEYDGRLRDAPVCPPFVLPWQDDFGRSSESEDQPKEKSPPGNPLGPETLTHETPGTSRAGAFATSTFS